MCILLKVCQTVFPERAAMVCLPAGSSGEFLYPCIPADAQYYPTPCFPPDLWVQSESHLELLFTITHECGSLFMSILSSGVFPFVKLFIPLPIFFFLFLKIYLFFNCGITALPNFVVFCQTSAWISHRYIYNPLPFEAPSCLPPHPTPLG